MIFATAGAKVFIGTAVTLPGADLTAASFTSQTWTEIKEVESIGTFGDTAEEITFGSVNDARIRKLKGTRNAGNMELVMGIDYADAGQLAVIAAEKTDQNYAFKVQFDDAPVDGTPSQRLFYALVMGAAEQLDQANNVMKLNSTLAINSNIVRVAAAEEA